MRKASAGKNRGAREGPATTGVTLELQLECDDEAVARALNDALKPDNRYFPKDQRFEASNDGPSIAFKVASPRARPALSTVVSIISDAALFQDVWVEARGGGHGDAAAQ